MSFFAELKRRNVIRVGIAYGAASWFLLQLADVILEHTTAPEWIMQTLMLALVIGFPIVLILAWAFEVTPEGIRRESEVDRSQSITQNTGRKLDRAIIAVLALTVGYLLLDKLILQNMAPPEATESAAETIIQEESASVAVLPFVNMSADEANEYFSDGLTETLLHMLAQLPDLRVAARTSSFAFKDRNANIQEVAAALGVDHVLEGSVQKSGDRVRITAQLIRASDGFHVWSQNYTRPLEDIFAIHDEIATDVASALGTSLLADGAGAMHGMETRDVTAYDLYLKGLEQQATATYGSLNTAENLFKQSLAEDPEFTDARLALIRNYLLKRETGMLQDGEVHALASPLIEQVKSNHPDEKIAIAFERVLNGRYGGQLNSREVIASNILALRDLLVEMPTETFIRTSVAGGLNYVMDEPEAAMEVIRAGLLIDPLDPELHIELARILLSQEKLDEAQQSVLRAMELAPEHPMSYNLMVSIEKQRDHLPAALNWRRKSIEIDPQDHELPFVLALDLYALGMVEEADRWNQRVQALVPGSGMARALNMIRAAERDDNERAIEIAQGMITDQVDTRRGAFWLATFYYADLMMETGRSREAYEFLVSTRPEIENWSVLPADWQGRAMQRYAVILMSGFASFEDRREAWNSMVEASRATGFDMLEEGSNAVTQNAIINGDIDAAVKNALEHRLSEPVAMALWRHRKGLAELYAPLYADPRFMVALNDREQAFNKARSEVESMLLQPEWSP